MPTIFQTKEDIPAVLAEMTLEEKAELVTGGSSYGTSAVPRFGIPNLLLIDNGAGVNFRQYLQELISRGVLHPDESLVDGSGQRQVSGTEAAFMLDHVDDRAALSEAENRLLDEFLAYIETYRTGEKTLPSCFPVCSLLASTWDPERVRDVARSVGREASAYGVDVLLGTACVNIQRDPLGGRNFESWSEDPFLTGEMAKEYALGVQEQGVLADVKHFAVNNQETRRHTVDAVISERALREIYLPAFKKVVQEGKVKTVMTSYNKVNGVSSSENKWLIEDVLRKEWGFGGTVMSDWGGVYHRVPSLEAGNDLCMPQRLSPQIVVDAVRSGELDEAVLDKACVNVLKMVADAPSVTGRRKRLDQKEAEEAAYKAAAGGIILLKNENGVLPLAGGRKVAFYGPLSRRLQDCGVGSGRVHTNKTTGLIGSAAALLGAENVLRDEVKPDTDTVIVTIGARGQEGADRSDMLPEPDAKAVLEKALHDAGTVGAKTVLLLNVAGPVDITAYLDRLDGILCLYYPGMQGGKAAADILCGKVSPSGKLAQSWPRSYRDCPSALSFPGEYDRAPYGEEIYVGYRYYEKKGIRPLFPFGFGLSYTSFAYSDPALSADVWQIGQEAAPEVSVTVTNTGSRAGAEVVQLYIADEESTQSRPVKELKGFRKVFLEPGESRRVTFPLDRDAFAAFDERKGWVVEPGWFGILFGSSSEDIRCGVRLRVKGFNPYGFGAETPYLYILKDARAVAAINHTAGFTVLSPEDVARQTNYLATTVSFRSGFRSFIVPKCSGMEKEEVDALFTELCQALALIDITDTKQQYEERNVD